MQSIDQEIWKDITRYSRVAETLLGYFYCMNRYRKCRRKIEWY